MERVVCLNDRQIEQAVSLLNAILDLDYFTEEEEQLIFRHAVCAVLNAVQHKLPQFFQHSQKCHSGLGPPCCLACARRPRPGLTCAKLADLVGASDHLQAIPGAPARKGA